MQNTALASSSPWIISKQQDLIWFIGSSVLGLTALLLALPRGGLPSVFAFIWALALDGPHVYSTATRAVFDCQERRSLGRTWLLLILILILSSIAIYFLGARTLFVFIATWGHYHISKQHMGFVLIYKRKANERADFKLDKYFTLVSLALPYLYFLSSLVIRSRILLLLFTGSGLGLVVFYVFHQSQLSTRNWPKLSLLASCIPLTWLAYLYAAKTSSGSGLLTAIIITNIPHSLQYLKLIWFHNSNRYSCSNGLLGILSRNWIRFFFAVVVLALPSHFFRGSGGIFAALAGGLLMGHYLIDSKIWRVRGNPELAAALKL